MAHMVPVVFVYVDGGDGEALYVDGRCVAQDTRLSALDVLSVLDGVLYSYGTGSLTYEYFTRVAKQEFPPNLADIPESAWEDHASTVVRFTRRARAERDLHGGPRRHHPLLD